MARRVISETKTVEWTERYCDRCGQNDMRSSIKVCAACHRDVCPQCAILAADPLAPREFDEEWYCGECYALSGPYAAIVSDAYMTYETIESLQREQWKADCRKAAGVPDA